jgi:hypothetical protein
MAPDPIADDDQSISNDVVLWRGIVPEQIKPDGTASDGAFRTKEMSVFIAEETDRATVLAKLRPGTRLRRFTAGDARGAGGVIRRAPEGGPGHCIIVPSANPGGRLSPANAHALNEASHWEA